MANKTNFQTVSAILKQISTVSDQLFKAGELNRKDETLIRHKYTAISKALAEKRLTDIPVEELSKVLPGTRIKVLHEHGIHTYADIYKSQAYTLAQLNGISPEGSFVIRRAVRNFMEQATQNTSVKISADDRSPEATELVRAVANYISSASLRNQCSALYKENEEKIALAKANVQPILEKSKLGWFFASKQVKNQVQQGYDVLLQMQEGDFAATANHLLGNLQKIQDRTDSQIWQFFTENNVDFNITLERLCGDLLNKTDDNAYGMQANIAEAVAEQQVELAGFKGRLRRYQEWGVKFIQKQKKVLLGDEMGLGKTVEAIAAMVSLHNQGENKFLVICPASVITNWCKEVERLCDLPLICAYGSHRKKLFEMWKKEGGVAITTFESMRSLKITPDETYSMIVVDEAHYVKNPRTQRYFNVCRLAMFSKRTLFMTGTAIENRAQEMLNLMQMLQPDVASKARQVAAMSKAPEFMTAVAPVYYRRKREQVLSELPELIVSEEWCELTDKEVIAYENAVLKKNIALARQVSWNVDNPIDSHKAARLLEIVKEAKAENRKVLVFSFFLNTLSKAAYLLEDDCIGIINGSLSPQARQNMIEQFEKAPAGSVIVAQIQAGGIGLNIQSASVVVICEPQFKPSAENQAISRAYRMGQSRNVLVYRLLAQNSIDERMTCLLKFKQRIFDKLADKSLSGLKDLEVDDASLKKIIDQEIARIKERSRDSDFTVDLSPQFLNQSFELFNKNYFGGSLKQIPVITSTLSKTRLGRFNFADPQNVCIEINEQLIPKYSLFRDILVHEMCHHYVYEIQGDNCGHNKLWQDTADKLNANYPELNITIYSDE